MGKVIRISFEDGNITIEREPDAGFETCADCWQGAGCDVRGACLIDDVCSPPLRTASLEDLQAEIERRKVEINAWGEQVAAAEQSKPTWAGAVPPVLDGGCSCCADEQEEQEKPVPLEDWLVGHDEPAFQGHSEAVSDADAVVLLNVAGVLMRKGVAIDDILLRMLLDG